MYPLKFENLYYDKIWGGRDMEAFRGNLPEGDIGESWDVACHDNGMSVVAEGELKGKSLKELIDTYPEELLGKKIDKEVFPLLIKIINSNESLSVQVHPDDEYGKRVENELGKTECWYIVDAKPGAKLILGTKEGVSKDQFKTAIENGTVEELMNYIEVKSGEVYFVESGLIHAIGEGIVLAEIQQNSDTTYRVYDYNRGRELHIEKALDVMNMNLRGKASIGQIAYEDQDYKKLNYILCDKFALEMYEVKATLKENSEEDRFFIFTCVEGNGTLETASYKTEVKKGDSILIPATAGQYVFKGQMNLLKSYVPAE
ncbi:type I phosphomannose isomerase catalytic subunit [Clostridium cellulovorans]|uniref:Phosphohexomutase n=1 Tax=Clostridium cellulovorans (strain ATCC 35296 / DSM 3052 / OCM 3 / 743B) TaxID=573061 RepID=D9SUC5_CLOC7|nr:type I phosphomannose isomerase catalytic subunit [Clostridium cellulovorans]ADL52880.1 mannose-6-phosphate isomerase, class I [Clostridium cellulovorans 743B]